MTSIFASRLVVLVVTTITAYLLLTIAATAQTNTQATGNTSGKPEAMVEEQEFQWTVFSDLPPYQFRLNVSAPDASGAAEMEVQIGDTATAAQTLTMDRGVCYAESMFAEDVNNDGYVDLALVCVDRSNGNATLLRSWLFDSVAGKFVPNPTDRLVASDELRD